MAGRSLPLLFLLVCVTAAEASTSTSSNATCTGLSRFVLERPNVTVEPGLVRVSLEEWTKGKGVGWKQPGRKPSYLLHLRTKTTSEIKEVSNETCSIASTEKLYSCNMTDLKSSTSYRLQVWRRTKSGGKSTCEPSGTATFTTNCTEPAVPEGLSATNVSSNSFEVQWTTVNNQQGCKPRYLIAVYNKTGDSIQLAYQREENKVQHLVRGLQADTEYTVEVRTSNKKNLTSSATSITVRTALPPGEPPVPEGLSATNVSSNSFEVQWTTVNNQQDCKPRYLIAVYNKTGDSIQLVYQRQENKVHHLVRGLQADTEYTVEVRTSNKENLTSSATSITVRTALPPGEPLPVLNITTRNATMTWLTVSWDTPSKFIASIAFYNVSLRPANATSAGSQPRNETVHTTEAEFGDLDGNMEYVAEVTACSTERCWDAVKGKVYTNPPKPSFKNDTEDVNIPEEPKATEAVFLLPLMDNPPGLHYVVLRRETAGSPTQDDEKQKLMDAALALVKRDVEGEDSDQLPDDPENWHIAAAVKQETHERLQVTVGNNEERDGYKNPPLESQTNYDAMAVTVKTNGNQRSWRVSHPLRFTTTQEVHTGKALGLLAGLVAAVALVVTAAILWLRRRRRGSH